MVNFNPDGKFEIKQGQGITQGIAEELGLDKDQCKQIDKSVWTKIFEEVDKEGSVTTTRNGQTAQSPNSSNNFLVYTNDIIQISKECWNKIVNWVNQALGVNINKLDETEKTEQVQESEEKPQTQAEKEQICKEAYETILANIDKLDLPNEVDTSNIRETLSQIYHNSHSDDLPENVELKDMIRSMLCELIHGCGFEITMSNEIAEYNVWIIFPENVQADNGLELCTVANDHTLQRNIEYARTTAIKLLRSLSDEDLELIGIDSDKRYRLISYLETIYYDNQEFTSTMQALTIDDVPFISVNSKLGESINMANMIAMLLHEANHCDREFLGRTTYNNKDEEKECERIGCMTTALLINKGVIPKPTSQEVIAECGEDFSLYKRYQYGFESYIEHPEYLEFDLNNWVQSSYTNNIDDDTCSITLEHNDPAAKENDKPIEIKSGDIVKIGSSVNLVIGTDCVLFGMHNQPIFQICDISGNKNCSHTNIVFDQMKPTKTEIQNCGRENLDIENHIETIQVVRKNADGTETVICSGYICGVNKS